MKTYHKIQTLYKRDPKNNYKTLLTGEFSKKEFEYLSNNTWCFTEKIDGTNIRIQYDGRKPTPQLNFKGKTDKAQIPPFLLESLQNIFIPKLKKFISEFSDNEVCFYGEGYGNKIQKVGKNYIKDGTSFVLFDVWINGWWLKREDVHDIGNKFNLDVVPIYSWGTLHDMVKIVKKGFNSKWGDFKAEGLIATPQTPLFNRKGERIITKLKHKDFK